MSHEARYRFLPWARRGLQPAYPDSLTGRVDVEGSLPVTLGVGAARSDGTGLGTADARVDLRLFGPGDVLGIDRRQVVRTVPRDGTPDFEPNYFPSVEFARPDLAWLFSPARAADGPGEDGAPIKRDTPWLSGRNLRPWMTLVVVPEAAATLAEGGTDTESPARLTVDATELPSPTETWAWAHVQVVGGDEEIDVSDPNWVAMQLRERSSLATCRLLCPRALEPNREYVACVVPTFDAGREAGLGRDPPTGSVITAWTGSDGEVTLPVYHSWRFATGPNGDFEALVERLRPAPVPRDVGYRAIDVREPVAGRDTLRATGDDPPTVTLAGALKSTTEPPGVQSYPADKRAELGDLLTLAADDGVPVVGPPVYGQWQAGASLPGSDEDAPPWLRQLNVDPENRAVAGLGARIVRDNQEELMDEAWEQVGQLREANRAVDRAVLGTMASERIHEELESVSPFDLKRLSRPFHDRIRVAPDAMRTLPGETLSGQTVGEFLERGPAPTAALSPSFARMVRRGSGPGRLISTTGATTPGSFVEAVDAGQLPLSGLSADGGGRSLPDDVADAIGVVIEERAKLADERRQRHDERAEEIDVLRDDVAEVRAELLARAESLESVVVVDPVPGRTFSGGGSTARDRLRTDHRLSVLRNRNLTSLSDLSVEDDDDVRGFSSVLTDLTIADLETTFERGNGRVLLEAVRLGSDLIEYRSSLETSVEIVGEAATLREYTTYMNEVDAVVTGGLRETVAAIRERPESFDDPGEIRNHVARLEAIEPLLVDLRESIAETTPPADRVATYYQRVWERHFEETPQAQVVSVSAAAAESSDETVRTDVLAALNPVTTIRDRLQTRLAGVEFGDELPDVIAPHPSFDRPMYEPVVETALDYFLPGVGDIPNNSLTLLETNSQFIESYLVGLNHEFARELRWREFPTDMRGTYFDRFWDTTFQSATGSEPTPDIEPIHRWRGVRGNDLGDHLQNHLDDGADAGETLVVVVRGDLLARYPNTYIYAERGRWKPPTSDDLLFTETTNEAGDTVVRETATDENGDPVVRAPVQRMKAVGDEHVANPAYEARYPIFTGTIAPDITFLGLPLTAEEARGSTDYADGDAGWFVVLEEPTGESRFGLDAASGAGGPPPTWDELAWDHVVTENGHLSLAETLDPSGRPPFAESTGAAFGLNSAHMAHITWQRPVRVAVHADDMLPREDSS